ncbi:MAG: ion transporter [Myxococcota bacterium]|nr:ion transporter [Myxococcota bacterium]
MDLRHRIHEVIFEADTPAGKAFDVGLLVAILLSILALILESVRSIDAEYHSILVAAEWFFTALFTVEYLLRLYSVRHPMRYATSFFGIVDLLAVLPTFLSLLVPGSQSLSVIRGLRMVRVFRIFKLARYLGEAQVLVRALRQSRAKITVFLTGVLTMVVIVGAAMHLIEGDEAGFTSIPQGMYWAVVTMTTVGYGDIAPTTVLGKSLASVLMVMGYSLIVVPTGIVSAHLGPRSRPYAAVSTQACLDCSAEGHDVDAQHCKYCGAAL